MAPPRSLLLTRDMSPSTLSLCNEPMSLRNGCRVWDRPQQRQPSASRGVLAAQSQYLEWVGDTSMPFAGPHVHVPPAGDFSVTGWAVDRASTSLAGDIDVVVGDTAFPAFYGIERPDVAASLGQQGVPVLGIHREARGNRRRQRFTAVIDPDPGQRSQLLLPGSAGVDRDAEHATERCRRPAYGIIRAPTVEGACFAPDSANSCIAVSRRSSSVLSLRPSRLSMTAYAGPRIRDLSSNVRR